MSTSAKKKSVMESHVSMTGNNFIIDEVKPSHGAIESAPLLTGNSENLPSLETSTSQVICNISPNVASNVVIVNNDSCIDRNVEVPVCPSNTNFDVARDEWKQKIAVCFGDEYCPDSIKPPALIPDTPAEIADRLLSTKIAANKAYIPTPPPSDTELENASNPSHTSYYVNYDDDSRSKGESYNNNFLLEDVTKFTTSLAYCIPFNMGIDAIPFSDPLKRKNDFLICPLAKCLSGYRADQKVEFCLQGDHDDIIPCKNTHFDVVSLLQHCFVKQHHCVLHRAIMIYTESRIGQINKSRSGISSKKNDKIALAKKT